MALKLGSLFYDIGADTSKLKKAEGEVKRTNKRVEKGFKSVGNAIKAALGFEAARRVLLMADNVTLLQARVKNLTSTQKEYNKVFNEIVAISNRVGQSIDATVSSFQRFSMTKEILNANNQELLVFTETIQKLGVVSGATGQEIASTSIQIGQAMSNNFEAAAQEINSINEQMPSVARAVEASLGLIPGSFKKAVTSGKVTARQFFDAIIEQADETNTKFDELPVTMERAWTSLLNNVSLLTAEMNEQWGLTKSIAAQFGRISKFIADGIKSRKETVDREKEISKILESRGLADYFSKDLSNAKRLSSALLQREALEKKITEAKKSDSVFASTRIKNAERQLEMAQETIDKLSVEDGRTKEVLATWKKLTAEITKARSVESAEADAPLVRTKQKAGSGPDPTGKNFNQLLASLGDERAAVKESFKQMRKEILLSQQLTDDDRLSLLKSNSEVRMESLREIAQKEIDIEKDKIAAKQALQQASDQAMLNATSQFANSVSELMRSAGKENSAIAKAAFLAQKAIQVASIIANTEAGATAALGVGPFGIPMSGIIRGMGYASAGIVAGLAVGSATGGGRVSGGRVSPGLMHPINENGDPEVLRQGSKQFLLPGSNGGDITSGSDMRMDGGGSPPITIVNNGAPLKVINQSVTKSEILIMVKNAEDNAVDRVDTSLASGKGSTFNSLKQGSEVQRVL